VSDIGDDFKALSEASKIKRAMNRVSSAERLTEAGIPFVSKNNGSHLIVDGQWDFWPGTGKFRNRSLPIEGRGVRGLLNYVKRTP
jgi:hypothetical protein